MSNLTALQQAMRIVEKYAPQLFDTYNANGRNFIDEMTPILAVEREQIVKAYWAGTEYWDNGEKSAEQYFNETYKKQSNE